MERREVMEAREQKRKVNTLRSWDFLVGVHDKSRMGALEAAADMFERGDDEQVSKWIKQLIAPGASLGGARPKASFRDADGTER